MRVIQAKLCQESIANIIQDRFQGLAIISAAKCFLSCFRGKLGPPKVYHLPNEGKGKRIEFRLREKREKTT